MSAPRPTRRQFLRLGAGGLASAALAAISGCSRESPPPMARNRKFVRRTLGRTGLELPVISMGSAYAVNLVRSALDAGIIYIHTSSGYGGNQHERMLGRVFRDLPRDSFVVATSPDLPYRFERGDGRSNDLGTRADPALIAKSLEGSLRRLGVDHVDIFYLCSVSTRESVLYEPYLRAFEQLRQAGKTRSVGIATHANEPAVIRAAIESGIWDVTLTAYNFRQTHRDQVRAAIREAAAAGLGVVAMKTQAGVYWDRARQRKINMKAALKWVLQEECVHTTIPAFSNFDELEEDLSVMENLALTPKERRDLALNPEVGDAGHFCQQCGQCLPQCPAGLEVPRLMRAAMYALGHRQPAKARATLSGWAATDVACTDCATCGVRCTLGLDIRSRGRDMARLLDVPEEFVG